MICKLRAWSALVWLLAACSGGGSEPQPRMNRDPAMSEDATDEGAEPGDVQDPQGPAIHPKPPEAAYPLLGSSHGGHYWFDFCEGKPDDTAVPVDPRELVVPGANQGKAVYFNAYWQTCQDDNHPGTCGKLRERAQRGYNLIAGDGEVGAGTTFAGDNARSVAAVPATAYAQLWKSMGFEQRPEHFDELLAERWGTPLSATPNPYPLEGEDPNDPAHPGGTGQLPMALTQLREKDGTWTGNIGITCNVCHSGKVGEAEDGPGMGAMYGTNSLSDLRILQADFGRAALGDVGAAALGMFAMNKVRGTGNITNFQMFGVLELAGNVKEVLPKFLSIQGEPSTGTEDPPVWWNLGHRVAKFFDAGQVVDAKRIELSFHFPNAPLAGDKQWILDNQQHGDAWMMSLRSPAWPEEAFGAIDSKLAEQGAVLFHSKNLWAAGLDNPVAKPEGGNGSCASCHGAYSPRFVNDPNYLDTPQLEGIAAFVVPIEIIGTDRRRLDGNSEKVQAAGRGSWFGYGEGPLDAEGNPLCGDWNDPALRGDRKLGYLAPPLYGVWATAPYFHNGSVPNIWEVLKAKERKSLWRRVSTPNPQEHPEWVMGFSTQIADYDTEKLGWKYDALECGDGPLKCEEKNNQLLNTGLVWNFVNPPIMTDEQIEDRKIYNTTLYSQNNSGHEFTSVLTDQEARAIIEYLKTL